MAASKLLPLIVFAAALAVDVFAPVAASDAWSQYKRDFKKSYADPEEEALRRELFMAELERVELHNSDTSASYQLGLNHMSDWTADEFGGLLGASARPLEDPNSRSWPDPYVAEVLNKSRQPAPEEFDWRKQEWPKRIGIVKNQSKCGSCWAFATTALIESQQMNRLNMSQLVPLSEQHLVDCSQHTADGCSAGGLVHEALDEIAKWGGIMSEHDYPYKAAVQPRCLMDARKLLAKRIKGHARLSPLDEEEMKKILFHYGPIAVSVAGCAWRGYHSGVLPASICQGTKDHAALIVGYGSDCVSGLDYWIVQNSWGIGFGEGGYIKIERNRNACQIATEPLIAKIL